MSNKKKQPTPKKVWQKLQRSPESDIREQRQRLRDQIKERFPDLTDKMIDAQENDETWGNDRYTVGVQYLDGNRDGRRVLYDTAPGIGRSRQTAEMSVAQ